MSVVVVTRCLLYDDYESCPMRQQKDPCPDCPYECPEDDEDERNTEK